MNTGTLGPWSTKGLSGLDDSELAEKARKEWLAKRSKAEVRKGPKPPEPISPKAAPSEQIVGAEEVEKEEETRDVLEEEIER